LDHTTAAAHLRALRDEDDPLIDLIENDRGLAGDLYQLRIPDEIADRASRVAWRPGQLHALRPVFRELGHPAAFVYEALEQAKGPQRSFDLTATTGLSRRAVYEALETLAAWHLVKPVDGRWRLVPGTSLQLLAEQFGCLEEVRTQVGRHRGERAAYRRALRIVDHHPAATTVGPVEETEAYLWPPEPPPEPPNALIHPGEPGTKLGLRPDPFSGPKPRNDTVNRTTGTLMSALSLTRTRARQEGRIRELWPSSSRRGTPPSS